MLYVRSFRNYCLFCFLLITILLLSPLAMASLPDMGNAEEVMGEVSGALTESQDPETREMAKRVRELSRRDLSQEQSGDCRTASSGETSDENAPEGPDHGDSPLDGNGERPQDVELFFDFQYMLSGENGEMSFDSVPIPRVNARDAIGDYARENGLSRQAVLELSDEELRGVLEEGAPYSLRGKALDDTVSNSLIITRMSQYQNVEDAMAYLEEEMGQASFGRKVNFLANYLNYLEDNYEYDMVDGGPTVGEDRWDQDLHSAMGESFRSGETIPAGVCRHMHQMAVRMARKMGIDEAFGVGFRTAGGGHRTMVLTHPDDPGKVVQLNYGSVSTQEGVTGPEALSQNHSLASSGIRFRIYNGEDRPAIVLPSELGGVLNRVTGGEDSDLGPNYESDAQVQQMGISTPYGTVRFFRAETPMGNQSEVAGGAYNARVDYNDVFYGEYGIAGFHSERPTQSGGMTESGGYARMTQGYDWKFYTSDNLNLRTFGELHSRVAVYCASDGDEDCEVNSDYNVDAQFGISADYITGPLSHRTTLLGQVQFDQAHASNGNVPTAILPTVSLAHDMKFEISEDVVGNAGGSVTMYNLGTGQYFTYDTHAGIEAERTGTSVRVESSGRIGQDTPIWLPDAERQGSVSVRQNIAGDRLYVGMEGRQSFDMLENHYVGFSFGGRFGP